MLIVLPVHNFFSPYPVLLRITLRACSITVRGIESLDTCVEAVPDLRHSHGNNVKGYGHRFAKTQETCCTQSQKPALLQRAWLLPHCGFTIKAPP